MSVQFVFGKPGGGKSLFAFRRIINELRHGKRPIVTNLPVLPDKLNEYLQETFPNETVDVLGRVRLITTQQLGQWWRYRGRPAGSDDSLRQWVDLPPPTTTRKTRGPAKMAEPDPEAEDDTDGATDFSTSPGPVLYVLDEIHIRFNARSWQATGAAALFYLSQHRKLGDDVVMISQTPAQVDKQLRSLSQEWIHVTNLGKLKTALFWTLPRRMLWRSYAALPGPGEPIMETGILKPESPGWADCYETAAGNSILGQTGADKADRTKGPSIVIGIVLAAAIAILAVRYIPDLFAFGFDRITGGTPKLAPKPTTNAPPSAPVVVAQAPVEVSPSEPEPQVEQGSPVLAWAKIGARTTYYLADGSQLDGRQLRLATPQRIITKQGTVHLFEKDSQRTTGTTR